MDNELYLIHLDDYLSHIDGKLDMYDLLLELVRSVRKDLEAGEPSQAMRTLCGYEQQAHEMYEGWDISDAYTDSGDPDDLAQLMEDELMPFDEMDPDDDGELLSVRLASVGDLLFQGAVRVRHIADLMADAETAVLRELAEGLVAEKPENDCAE